MIRYALLVTMALLSTLNSYSAWASTSCFKENQSTTLNGKLISKQATSVHDGEAYEYPVLVLSRPICYADTMFGEVQGVTNVAIVGGDISGNLYGKLVRVRGLISKTVTADQPPQALMLFQANVEARK